MLANISPTISTVSVRRSAQTRAPAVAPKKQRKMLTIAKDVTLLDMLKEGTNYVAIERHYGIRESPVRYIEEEATKF